MATALRKLIRKFALPAAGLGLVGFGLGGKSLPTFDAMIGRFEHWLTVNTDYPSLVVAGVVILVLWALYQTALWWFVSRKEKWRGQLIAFLNDGVKLRNEGEKQITTQVAASQWISKADAWNKKVYNKIKEIDENGVEDYQLLDVSPNPRLCIKTNITDHAWYYQHHDYRLVKLRELVSYHRAEE